MTESTAAAAEAPAAEAQPESSASAPASAPPSDARDAIIDKLLAQNQQLIDRLTTHPPASDTAAAKPAGLKPANAEAEGGLTREKIEKMTPAEINENWDAVQVVLAQDTSPARNIRVF